MTKSQLKVKVNNTVRYIDCNVHSAKYNNDETIELLIRIGRQTMWVPRSEVTLAQPFKVTIDLK